MELGYVKLWRKSIDSAVFADPILWKLWSLCLMKANHKKTFVSIEGIAEPIEVCPGAFITGRFALHKEFYPKSRKKQKSPLTLWRKLQNLKNMQNLNIRSHAKYSIISINNWKEYQQNGQPVNNRRTTGEQPVNTDKNEKNEKNKYKDYVFLTEKEHKRLISDFGEKVVESKIEDLDNYIGTDPAKRIKSYKDHNRVIRTWLKKDGIKKTETTRITCPACKEQFTEKDLKDGKCPVCGAEVKA